MADLRNRRYRMRIPAPAESPLRRGRSALICQGETITLSPEHTPSALMNGQPPPPIPPGPPPLPGSQSPAGVRLDPKSIPGLEGMMPEDLQQAVAHGGRFVLFQFCISVLILTFKRSSPIIFVKPGQSTVVRGLPYSLISLVAGWWGIPWGPIWTISTLVTNLGGGKNLTGEVMQALGVPLAAPGL